MRQAEQDLHMASHHTHQHSALSSARVGWHPEQRWLKEVRQGAHVSIVHAYLLFFNVSKSVLNVNRAAKKGAVVLTITTSEDFSPLSGRGVSCLSGFISNRSNFPHWFWAHSTVCIATQSKAMFALWSNTGNGIENGWMECKCKKGKQTKNTIIVLNLTGAGTRQSCRRQLQKWGRTWCLTPLSKKQCWYAPNKGQDHLVPDKQQKATRFPVWIQVSVILLQH